MKNFLFLALFFSFYSNASDFQLILNNNTPSSSDNSSVEDYWTELLFVHENNETAPHTGNIQELPQKIGRVITAQEIEKIIGKREINSQEGFYTRLNKKNLTFEELEEEELENKKFYQKLEEEYAQKFPPITTTKKRSYPALPSSKKTKKRK